MGKRVDTERPVDRGYISKNFDLRLKGPAHRKPGAVTTMAIDPRAGDPFVTNPNIPEWGKTGDTLDILEGQGELFECATEGCWDVRCKKTDIRGEVCDWIGHAGLHASDAYEILQKHIDTWTHAKERVMS